jgi:hypothetical protein
MTEEDSESAFDKVKHGVKKVLGGGGEIVEGTAKGVEEVVEDTKEGVEDAAEDVNDTAEGVTDSDTYTDSEHEREKRDYNESGGKEPMNPEDIASHEPTAVKRDKKQGTSGDPV